MKTRLVRLLCAALLFSGALTSNAQQLTVGTATVPSIDPHFAFFVSNVAYAKHVFSSLTTIEKGKLVPDLAVSWRSVAPTIWEFKLRPNVKFHDGSAFTGEDVAFSVDRVLKIKNSPSPYAAMLTGVKEVQVVDPLTVRFNTSTPEPLLPRNLNSIAIVSHKIADGSSAADFNSGKAAIGTGPFKFSAYMPGERYELTRNDGYYGNKPEWQKVSFRIITQDASRIAALLAGDVDLIEAVPPGDVPKLKENKNVAVRMGSSDRLYLMFYNVQKDSNSFITDKKGTPLARNPFKDKRVREAMSLAIDRKSLVARVMNGAGVPANQMTYPGATGFNNELPPLQFDPAKAKRLLADAGFPEGFGLTVHCSNDRYPNDARICQTVGQMLARIGLAIKVETLPKAVYFGKAFPPNTEYAFGLFGASDPSGEGTTPLTAVVQTRDPAAKAGLLNIAGYSNAAVDQRINQLRPEFDPAKRAELARSAMGFVAADLPYLPLFVGSVVAASKANLAFEVRIDEMTLAQDVRLAK
jgi:peptide/nickel transport system substrate-binding protein